MLQVAAQHGQEDLVFVCEVHVAKSISTKTIVSVLSTAYLYDLKCLKSACLSFIKKNAAALLVSSSFRKKLETDHHMHIWEDLKDKLGGDSSSDSESEDAVPVDDPNPNLTPPICGSSSSSSSSGSSSSSSGSNSSSSSSSSIRSSSGSRGS